MTTWTIETPDEWSGSGHAYSVVTIHKDDSIGFRVFVKSDGSNFHTKVGQFITGEANTSVFDTPIGPHQPRGGVRVSAEKDTISVDWRCENCPEHGGWFNKRTLTEPRPSEDAVEGVVRALIRQAEAARDVHILSTGNHPLYAGDET